MENNHRCHHYHGDSDMHSDLMKNSLWVREFNKKTFKNQDLFNSIESQLNNQANLSNSSLLQPFTSCEKEDSKIRLSRPYISGIPLLNFLESNGPIRSDLLHHMTTVANALQYLHQNNIMGMSLKLSNIIMTFFGGLVLIDFGISAITDDTFYTQSIYSLLLSGPEGIKQGYSTFSRETDIFQLGIIYYAMIYGSLPWSAMNIATIYSQLVSGEIPFPENFEVNHQLIFLVKTMLSPNPVKRPTIESILNVLNSQSKVKFGSEPVIYPKAKRINNARSIKSGNRRKSIDLQIHGSNSSNIATARIKCRSLHVGLRDVISTFMEPPPAFLAPNDEQQHDNNDNND